MPSMGNIDDMIKKAKEMGGDQLKQVEQAASKVLAEVNKAKKDGKGQADAFLSGLKQGKCRSPFLFKRCERTRWESIDSLFRRR